MTTEPLIQRHELEEVCNTLGEVRNTLGRWIDRLPEGPAPVPRAKFIPMVNCHWPDAELWPGLTYYVSRFGASVVVWSSQ